MTPLNLNKRQYLELEKLSLGAFSPVNRFMDETTFTSVVDTMRLPDGNPFPIPIILDVSAEDATRLKNRSHIDLYYENANVGTLEPNSFFQCDRQRTAAKIFGTTELTHPGVSMFYDMAEVFVGGQVSLTHRVALDITRIELTPDETRKVFAERGWKQIVGFQTRNVPHRAHEWLQRVALEHVDGLFIQPLLGQKKKGDFTPESIMTGYEILISNFYPTDRVLLSTLSTFMRYAGPREAVFHAIIRRNYGCTHFVVGRDHAGVGNYYGKYDAHALTKEFDGELGIEIMRLHGPYHCCECDGIVTEHTCPHLVTAPTKTTQISGTAIRKMLSGGARPQPHLMRPQVVESLAGINLFLEESE